MFRDGTKSGGWSIKLHYLPNTTHDFLGANSNIKRGGKKLGTPIDKLFTTAILVHLRGNIHPGSRGASFIYLDERKRRKY